MTLKGIPVKDFPRDRQLSNYIMHERRKMNGGLTHASNLTTADLYELKERLGRERTPEGEKRACIFVIFVGPELEDPKFYIFLSSEKLMNVMARFGCNHLDTTYKIVFGGYPVIIPMFTDGACKGFEVGIVIAFDEKDACFKFIADVMKNGPTIATKFTREVGVDDNGNTVFSYTPSNLIADSDTAICKGVFKVQDRKDIMRGMCWRHKDIIMVQQMKARVKDAEGETDHKKIHQIDLDLDYVQLARCPCEFAAAITLLMQQWHQDPLKANFCQYYESSPYFFGGKLSGWYEGLDPRALSTNNSGESRHKRFKHDHMNRTKAPLATLIPKALQSVQIWSDQIDTIPGKIPATSAFVSNGVKVAAWHWVRRKLPYVCASDYIRGLNAYAQNYFQL